LAIVHGLCWFLGWALLAAFLLGLLDYLLRFQDRGVRVICTAACAGAVIWSFRRFVRPAFRQAFADVEVAQKVERYFPQLDGRLASSVEFLNEEPRRQPADSAVLRGAVISEAEHLVRGLDLLACLDWSTTRRAILMLLPLVLLIGAVFALDFGSAALAARRLATPWSNVAWPTWNSLEFAVAPRRIAMGQDFAVTVLDRHGRLPADATMQYWFEGDSEDEIESKPMQVADGRAVQTRRNVTRSFRYRAVGGDDGAMQWISLEVVEAPTVQSLQIQVSAPAHTGIAEVQSSGGALRVIEGSSLTIKGRADRAISAARWHIEAGDQMHATAARLEPDRQTFTISEVAAPAVGSGPYWLELVDDDGVTGGQETRSVWEVIPDGPPSIALASSDLHEAVTREARLPLHVRVTDDLAVRELVLEVAGESHVLYAGPGEPPRRLALPVEPEVREVEYQWDLGELSLAPDGVVQFQLLASDYRPQQARSPLYSFAIISSDEFDYRIQEQQKALLRQLLEALRVQQLTSGQVMGLGTQLEQVGTFQAADVSLLQSCELQQRQVERLLGNEPGSAASLLGDSLAAMESNRRGASHLAVRLTGLSRELARINQERLPIVRNGLLRSAKEASSDPANRHVLGPLLTHIGHEQEQVIAGLERLISQLSQWDDYRRISRDVAKLLREQQEVARQADQSLTLGKTWEDLSDQERADLQRLSQEQLELARRFERLRGDMAALRSQLEQVDPAAAGMLSEAIRSAGQGQVAEQMRESGANLAKNQLRNASQAVGQVEAGLRQLLDVLTGRQSLEDAETAWAARLEQELSELTPMQRAISQDTRQRQQLPDDLERDNALMELVRRQQGVADRTRQVREESTPPPAFALGLASAEKSMTLASERLRHRLADDESARLQSDALRKLEQLLAALQATPPPPRSDEIGQPSGSQGPAPDQAPQPDYSVTELKLLRLMQLEVNERTSEFDQEQAHELDEAALRELRELATEQQGLAELVQQMQHSDAPTGDRPAGPPLPTIAPDLDRALQDLGISSFGSIEAQDPPSQPHAGEDVGTASRDDPLTNIAENMQEAGRRLRSSDTSQQTQQVQRTIVRALEQLVNEMQQQQPEASSASASSPQQEITGRERGAPPTTPTDVSSPLPISPLEKIWGSLPDRIRQQIQSPSHEEFLPRYERVIEEYYKRLAEEQQRLRE